MVDKYETTARKPKDSNFHQQSLPAWNPVILITTVYPFFGCIGLTFIFIGIGLLITSLSVSEFKVDYTNCNEYDTNMRNNTQRSCSEVLNNNFTSNHLTCTCKIYFKLEKNFKGQVYFYYFLQNFYQNHRQYFQSRDDNQLLGKSSKKVSSNCNPFGEVKNGSNIIGNYAPCGLIANSLFNDTFDLALINGSSNIRVPMTIKGIAWKSDINLLFGRPANWNNTFKPVNWKLSAYDRNHDSYKGDEEFIVWMRNAALSEFKKLNRIINHNTEPFLEGLPAGTYQLVINYAYPVTIFGGRKFVILSTTSPMGGKNNNMGIMYITLGSLHELIAFVFFIFTFYKRDREENYSAEMKKRTMKSSFSDTPLIMTPLTPESYGIKEPGYRGPLSNTNG